MKEKGWNFFNLTVVTNVTFSNSKVQETGMKEKAYTKDERKHVHSSAATIEQRT